MNGPVLRRALGQSGRPADAFVGRRDELAVISSYADAIVSGSPWVIWVEGDAGSGKTALVRQALSGLSSEVRVLQATADELSADVSLALAGSVDARQVLLRVIVPFGALYLAYRYTVNQQAQVRAAQPDPQ